MRFVGLLLLVAPILTGVGACTSTVTPPPSAAILAARASAVEQAKHARDPVPCADPRKIEEEDGTMVRFRFLSAEMDPVGLQSIGRAAAFARCAPATTIVLVAESDGRATEAAQQALIAQRITAMRQALTAAGIADGRISAAASRAAAPAGPLVLLGRNLGGI
jgi:outer membrane protein OmpA-like peptidoglycan-associated protein